MNRFNVQALGGFSAHYSGLPPIRFSSSKGRELLGYLIVAPERTHPREFVADMLWNEATIEQSKKYLRTELWRLRRDTSPLGGGPPLVTASKESIRLNPDIELWSDIGVVESAYAVLKGRTDPMLSAAEHALLEEAVQAYEGPLFAGWYQDWFEAERDRLQQLYIGIADTLICRHEKLGQYESAITLALRVLRTDPTRESTHRDLMRLYFETGNPAGALAQFERCSSTLRERLGIAPSPVTLALYQRLRGEASDLATAGFSTPQCIEPAVLMQRIDQLQRELDSLRHSLRREGSGGPAST